MKLRVDDDSMDPADSSVAIIMRRVCISDSLCTQVNDFVSPLIRLCRINFDDE